MNLLRRARAPVRASPWRFVVSAVGLLALFLLAPVQIRAVQRAGGEASSSVALAASASAQHEEEAARESGAGFTSTTFLAEGLDVDVILDVSLGYAEYQQVVKSGMWYPLWAKVTAASYDVDGQLTFTHDGSALRVVVPLQVAKGSTKLFRTYFKLGTDSRRLTWKLNIEIEAERLGREEFPIELRITGKRAQHYLVLAEDRGSFDFLATPPEVFDDSGRFSPFMESHVIYGDIKRIPDDPIGLESLDAVIIATPRVREITVKQWEALKGWVAMGGRLLLAGGEYQPLIEQSNLRDAFGITLGSPEPASSNDLLRSDSQSKGGGIKFLASWPQPTADSSWDKTWLGDEDHPFLIGKRVGRGWFQVCAASLNPGLFPALSDAGLDSMMWTRLLERHGTQSELQVIAGEAEEIFGLILQRPLASELPGAWSVFAFLALYIFLAVPFNWWACARLRRKDWVWSVAVILAIGFAGYGYFFGSARSTSLSLLNEITLISRPPGVSLARASAFSSFYSPRRYRSDLSDLTGMFPSAMKSGLPDQLFWAISDSGGLYANRPFSLFFGNTVKVGDFYLYAASARNLRSEFMLGASGGIETPETVRIESGNRTRLEGTIVNTTPWTFERWWIGNRNELWIGQEPLGPGDAISVAALPYRFITPQWDQRHIMAEALIDAFAGKRKNLRAYGTNDERFTLRTFVGFHGFLNEDFAPMDDAERLLPYLSRPPGDRLALKFFGEAEGSVSPLRERLAAESHEGLILYEEELPGRRMAGPDPSTSMGRRWKPVTATPLADWRWGPNNDFTGNALRFRPRRADVQLVPDRPFTPPQGQSMRITMSVASLPKDLPVEWERVVKAGPLGPFFTVPLTLWVSVMGFPVSIYNHRSRAWEPLGAWYENPPEMFPAENYLHPVTSAITLKLDGRREGLRLRLVDPNDLDNPIIVEASDRRVSAPLDYISFLELGNISVTFSEPQEDEESDEER